MVIALSPSPKVTFSPFSSTATSAPVIALSAAPAARSSGDLPQAARQTSSETETTSGTRSEEHTSELQSLMRISYAVFCLKKKKTIQKKERTTQNTNTAQTE